MPGSLNDILPDPISEADEEILLDLLHRKMGVLAGIAVDLLHAVEERFGPEVRKVVRDMAKGQEFPQRENTGDPEKDLHEFCDMAEKAAVGSHRWERVIDEPDRVGYRFTRCMYAEIFRDLGEPELGLVLCARDEPWVKSYNPRLGFRRTKELMSGDDVCDHIYLVEREH